MRIYGLSIGIALMLTGLLPAYGGQQESAKDFEHEARLKFSSQISFGDSLTDVGSYAVGTVAALGGGQFTVNSASSKNWTAWMAAQLGLPAPCAAQTGLDGSAAQGFSVMPPVNHPGCTSYAQGGARVTHPVGIGNKLTGGANVALGFLTVPVAQQVQNHLASSGGKFKDDEIVFVLAGANDVFFQLGLLQVAATNPDLALAAIATAASELATTVKTQIVAKGAKHVVVVNLPDITITPFSTMLDASARNLLDAMVRTFNYRLGLGLADSEHVLMVDAYADSRNQYINPTQYGLNNVTDTACDLTPAKNPLGSSLICTANNLIPGATEHYMFADRLHPTPYGNWLLARLVTKEMITKGWRWKKPHMQGRNKDF